MKSNDLTFPNLEQVIKRQLAKGRTESAAFLKWFLENIYRLEEVAADDSICDHQMDKGIDGIFIDHALEEIHFLQAKTAQKANSTIGDTGPKTLLGSVKQFDSKASIQKILNSNADPELKKLIVRQRVDDFVEKGYRRIAVYVSNQKHDKDSRALEDNISDLRVYDRDKIASAYVDFDADEGIKGSFTIDTSYASFLKITVPPAITVYQTLVEALSLTKLKGIADGTLFKQNVRLSLGNTPVNKAISESIQSRKEHKYFPLYHNGVTILCDSVTEKKDSLTINDYVVVNGAQSLTTFLTNKNKLSSDLKIFVRIVSLRDADLSRKISTNSNNQNAIKARDLRANHDLMIRLQSEFTTNKLPYNFEIKRGEHFDNNKEVISNEVAGRLLLAFDLAEPFSCHQIYKVFDEKYAEIFGRPEVDCFRIAFIFEVMKIIEANLSKLTDERMAKYTLTKYIALDIIAHILKGGKATKSAISNRQSLHDKKLTRTILKLIPQIAGETMINLNFETANAEMFDYKAAFKSPEQVKGIRDKILLTHQKDVVRGKARKLDKL